AAGEGPTASGQTAARAKVRTGNEWGQKCNREETAGTATSPTATVATGRKKGKKLGRR
ncbi:hypothetical protein LINPERPRIM_LOCUS14931, partial [Linum perenne]